MKTVLASCAACVSLLLCTALPSFADFGGTEGAHEKLDESGFVETVCDPGQKPVDSNNQQQQPNGVQSAPAMEYEFAGVNRGSAGNTSGHTMPGAIASPLTSPAPTLPDTRMGLTAPNSFSMAPIGRNKEDYCFPKHVPGQAFNGIYNQIQPGAVLPPTSTSTIDIQVADRWSMRNWYIMQAHRLGIAPEVIQFFVDTDDQRGLEQHIRAVKAAQDAAKEASVGAPN